MNKYMKIAVKNTVISICFISYVISSNLAYAGSQILDYQIRQEKVSKNGVMTMRPKAEDEKIYNLLANNGIHSLEDYAKWLVSNVVYKKDTRRDTWSKPLDVIAKKYGDCEDFTLLNITILRILGYSPKFWAFYTKKSGHAVCVFKKNNQYYYFDNMELKQIKESDILEFARNISSRKSYTEIKELNLETRKWNLVYKNS